MNPQATKRMREILAEHGVTGFRSLNRLSPKTREHLDTSIYGWFAAFREKNLQSIATGINLCMSLRSGPLINNCLPQPVMTAIKKLTFFSQKGVLLTPEFHLPGSQPKSVPDTWYHLMFLYLPHIENELLTILPRGVEQIDDSTGWRGETFIIPKRKPLVNKTWSLLDSPLPSLKVIDVSVEELERQMLELRPQYRMSNRPAGRLRLPYFTNLSIDMIARLRAQHTPVFQDFNKEVANFFTNTAAADTETRLVELMQQTDEKIRGIHAELRKIARSKALLAGGITLKLTSAALLPYYFGRAGAAWLPLIGGNLVSDGVKYVEIGQDLAAARRKAELYFPWHVHSHSRVKIR